MRCARLHTIAVIIFLSGAAASAQTPESPHDLWEHMIAAKGGHERLQSVRTICVDSDARHSLASKLVGGPIDGLRGEAAGLSMDL
jgi:hypothetical protein